MFSRLCFKAALCLPGIGDPTLFLPPTGLTVSYLETCRETTAVQY